MYGYTFCHLWPRRGTQNMRPLRDPVHTFNPLAATRYTFYSYVESDNTWSHNNNICCHVCWKILFVVTRVVTCDHITYRRIFLGGQGHLSMGRENIKVVTAKMWQHVNTHVNINKFLWRLRIFFLRSKERERQLVGFIIIESD